MRFVLAIVLFVCALAAVGLGLAQRTVLAGPDQLVAAGDVGSSAPVTVIDGATLTSLPGNQTLTVNADGDVFVAYGRTIDVLGWVGEARYNTVGYDAETTELVGDTAGGTETEVPSPIGSDLWLAEREGTGRLTWSLNLPADMSVIVMGEPDAAAPGDISVRWPLDNSAPASFWLIVGGLSLLVLGLIAFVWALVHERRRRGPRRRQPRLPRAPKPPRISARSLRALPATPERGRRRSMTAAGAIAVAGLALSGCTALGGGVPEPSPSATAETAAAGPVVAVTPRQLDAIVDRATSTIADADAALDADLAATRLSGPALEQRKANYTLRAADAAIAAEPAIPNGSVDVMLPQTFDEWPRSVFAVVSDPDDETKAPMALMLIQSAPREQYRIDYAISLQPGAVVPALAPKTVGAPRLAPDSQFFQLQPDQLAAAYGDVLLNGEASASYELFAADDQFREVLVADKAKRKSELSASAALAFSNRPGDADPIVFGTADTGAIVAVELDDVETVTPAEAGAAINPTGSVKILSGKTQTTKGIVANYGLQLLFYVPPVGDTERTIVLLGGSQSIISATEVP